MPLMHIVPWQSCPHSPQLCASCVRSAQPDGHMVDVGGMHMRPVEELVIADVVPPVVTLAVVVAPPVPLAVVPPVPVDPPFLKSPRI